MAGPDGNTPNPNPQGGEGEGGNKKLIFGKYKTIEEAEEGYKNLEKGFHGTRQELSELKELIETRLPAEGSYGQGGNYGRTTDADPADKAPQAQQVLTRFYVDPVGTLTAVKESAKQEMQEEQRKERQMAQRVAQWAAKNQDVTKYEDLMSYHVAQTDARWAPEKRLDEAAKAVRARLAELRGTPKGANPKPGDYTPGPSSFRDENAGGGGEGEGEGSGEGTTSTEAALVAHVAERNSHRLKPLGRHGR